MSSGVAAENRSTGSFVINTDGSDEQRLTSADWESAPVWSPDGKRIPFTPGLTIDAEVWVMDADGNNRREFIDGRFAEPEELDWVPTP